MSSATARRHDVGATRPASRRARDDVLGAVRVVLRNPDDQIDPAIVARLDAHVQRFIESHWMAGPTSPRRHVRLGPLAYALMDAAPRPELAVAVADFAARMSRFLFGEDHDSPADVLCHVAGSRAVALFLHAKAEDARAQALGFAEEEDDHDPAPDLQGGAQEPEAEAVDIGFCGVFDARHGVILASVAALRSPAPGRTTAPAAYAEASQLPLDEIHAQILARAEAERTRPRPSGAPLIYTPVDYSVIAQPKRFEAFLEAAAALPERALGLIVCDAPNFAPQERLRAGVRRLLTRFRFVDWEVSAGDVNPASFAGAGLHSLTLAAPEAEADHRAALTRFLADAEALRAQRLRIGVRGIKDAAGVAQCVEAGADFLAGPGVTALADQAFTPRRVAPADLPLKAAS